MDRVMLSEHLALAEKHVAQGEAHILRQKKLIASLENDGHDATSAWELLRQFEESQDLHIADRNRLRKELQSS